MNFINKLSLAVKSKTESQRSLGVHLAIALSFALIAIGYMGYIASQTLAQTFPVWYDNNGNNDFQYRQKITVDGNQVSSIETDTVLTVNIPSGNNIFTNASHNEGFDVTFVDIDNTTKLDHEIELFDSTLGQALFRVKIPSLSPGVNTDIYMYYGDPNITNSQESLPGTVYNNDYAIFYEMNLVGSDSTSNARNITGTVGGPIEDNTILGLGVEYGRGTDAWNMAGMPYWEAGWATRTQNVVFKTGSDVDTRQVILAEGGSSNGILLYIFESNLYARWWSESLAWDGDNLVTADGIVNPDSTYYVTMSYNYPGSYNLWVNGQEENADITHSTIVAMNAHGGDGGIAYTGTNTKDFHDILDSQGHYFSGTIAQLEVLDIAWNTAKHATWYNMLNDSAFLTFAVEEDQDFVGSLEATYTSQEFILVEDGSEAYIKSLDYFEAMIGADNLDLDDPTDPLTNDKAQIDLYIKLINKDGFPMGFEDSQHGWFVLLAPDEDISEKFKDLTIDQIAKVQFKIYMQTDERSLYIPWVEFIKLDYTVTDDTILQPVGIISFTDTTTDTQSVEKGEPANYEIEFTPNIESHPLINTVTLNIAVSEPNIEALPVDIIIDHNSDSYLAIITLQTNDQSPVMDNISFDITAIVTDPDRSDYIVIPDPLVGVLNILDGEGISVQFTSPTLNDIWYYEDSEEIKFEGTFNSAITDDFTVTFYARFLQSGNYVEMPIKSTDLISPDIDDGHFVASIEWDQVGYLLEDWSYKIESGDDVYIKAYVFTNGIDFHSNYTSEVFSIRDHDDPNYPAITINASVPLELGLSSDLLTPEFTLRLYESTVTDPDDTEHEVSGITADSYDTVTKTATLQIDIAEGILTNNTTYASYIRSTRHLWDKAITNFTVDIDDLTYDITFPKLVIGDISLDNIINAFDFNQAILEFGKLILPLLADFNNDGVVNVVDIGFLFPNWFKEGVLPA